MLPMSNLITNENELFEQMTFPSDDVIQAVSKLDGNILILGVGGKMGPTLAELLVRAGARNVIGVSRFGNPNIKNYLSKKGIKVIQADLLNETELTNLPDATNIFFLAGFKFGMSENLPMTWAMNSWLPGRIMQRFPESQIIYLSSGNVYGYTSVASSGANETSVINPIGEYAKSRLAGERIAEHFSLKYGTRLLIVRLFYATELRYGIIHDLARKVFEGIPIDLNMGHINQIWQGDATRYLARLFPKCTSPGTILNMAGPEVLSVRTLANLISNRLETEPIFEGNEKKTALLGDAQSLFNQFGFPNISTTQIIEWVAHWIRNRGASLGKPTGYESRTGQF